MILASDIVGYKLLEKLPLLKREAAALLFLKKISNWIKLGRWGRSIARDIAKKNITHIENWQKEHNSFYRTVKKKKIYQHKLTEDGSAWYLYDYENCKWCRHLVMKFKRDAHLIILGHPVTLTDYTQDALLHVVRFLLTYGPMWMAEDHPDKDASIAENRAKLIETLELSLTEAEL